MFSKKYELSVGTRMLKKRFKPYYFPQLVVVVTCNTVFLYNFRKSSLHGSEGGPGGAQQGG